MALHSTAPPYRKDHLRPWSVVRILLWVALALWATLSTAQPALLSARFERGCDGMRMFLTTPLTGTQYTWTLSDGQNSAFPAPVFTVGYGDSITISLTVLDAFGESIYFNRTYPAFTPVDLDAASIPNVLTPNNDGINDTFELPGQTQLGACAELRIFDRYGHQVFIGQGNNLTWDGRTMAGEACIPAVYFYTLTVYGQEFNGHLTLFR
ncbi:MAG: gliding motility-associated C-terminal domain-containing protein [Flavobacteriales bacterium]|jgi:gliding motility-associated-like protein|nr:gliding motility-associated C-terminal domain-containing protein [Flavobacteriales bacterium]